MKSPTDEMTEFGLHDVRISVPEDVRPAAELLRDKVRDMANFRVAVCHDIAVGDPMADSDGNNLATDVFGWTNSENDSWWRTPRLALISPLPNACRYESEPFWCNEDGFRTNLPNPQLARISLEHLERRARMPAAIVVPVHLPYGQIGAASYCPSNRSQIDLAKEFETYGDILGLLTRTFVASYVRVMCRPKPLPVDTLLSKREVECLAWAAVGKTDQEISMILERSPATVRFHLHNAAVKLDSVNRSQTVFKAAQLGYIASLS